MTEATDPVPAQRRFEFTGSGGEYFRIWIVNLALSILTLGIYSAWAKVRRLKYFHGNTRLDGHAFDYHGQPLAILKGRLIGVALLIVYVFLTETQPYLTAVLLPAVWLAIPWIATRSRIFQMRMTSYRGVRFDFEADYRGAIRALLLAPLASILSLGLALPWATRERYRWLIGNTAYGRTYFELDVGLRPLARAALVAVPVLVLAVVVVIGGISVGYRLVAWYSARLADPDLHPVLRQAILLSVFVIPYLLMLLVGYIGLALWRSMVLNATLSASRLGPAQVECNLSPRRLAWIYLSNFLGIVLTLGMFIPWAQVRSARYQLESTGYSASVPLDSMVAAESERSTATGEELGELMDVDVSI